MNALAEQLIHDLRFDPFTREHFSISAWSGKGTCGTVGCIAGTAILRAYPEAKIVGIDEGHARLDIQNVKESPQYAELGMMVLELPSYSVANQLFLPWDYWLWPLRSGFADFIFELSDNERPNLDTVEKMVAWAKARPGMRFGPTTCANALENVLRHDRMYADWAEAWVEESV